MPKPAKRRRKKNTPPAMSVVTVRLPDQLRDDIEDFLDRSGVDDRSTLVRLAVASYIGKPELAKQSKEAA